MVKKILSLLILSSFAACFGVSIDDVPDSKPKFLIEEYFKGKTTAWGIVLDRSGKPIKRLTVKLEGVEHPDGSFQLNEDFSYDDNTKEKRTWYIKKKGDNSYEGSAHDVVGVAKGFSKGSSLNWSYVLNLEVEDTHYEISFNDWMFLHQDENVLINRAIMTKFGFKVGEILIFFKKD